MCSICNVNKNMDLVELGDKLLIWFLERGWEFHTNRSEREYIISAKKTDALRQLFCANRALNVRCYREGDQTYVKIVQGPYIDNLMGNLTWLMLTGGTNVLISAWSLRVEGQFKEYTQKLLSQGDSVGTVT